MNIEFWFVLIPIIVACLAVIDKALLVVTRDYWDNM